MSFDMVFLLCGGPNLMSRPCAGSSRTSPSRDTERLRTDANEVRAMRGACRFDGMHKHWMRPDEAARGAPRAGLQSSSQEQPPRKSVGPAANTAAGPYLSPART